MNIRLEYALTLDDFHDLQVAYRESRGTLVTPAQRLRRILFLAAFATLIVCWGIVWILTNFFPPGGTPDPAARMKALLGVLPWVLIFVVVFITSFLFARSKRRLKPIFSNDLAKLAAPHTVDITTTNITIREPGCITEMEWSYFFRFVDGPSTFLLFLNPRSDHILPKRAFPSDAAANDFRSFAQATVNHLPNAFPVQLTIPPALQQP